MKFEAWELVEGNRCDQGVLGEDGFAGEITSGDDAADVHGVPLGMREYFTRIGEGKCAARDAGGLGTGCGWPAWDVI